MKNILFKKCPLTVGGKVPMVLRCLRVLVVVRVIVLGRHRLHVAPVPFPLPLAAGVSSGNYCVAATWGHVGTWLGRAIVVT